MCDRADTFASANNNKTAYTDATAPLKIAQQLTAKSALRKVASISRAVPLELGRDSDNTSLLEIDPSILRPVRWVRFVRGGCISGLRRVIGQRMYDRHLVVNEDQTPDEEVESEEAVEQCNTGSLVCDLPHEKVEDAGRPAHDGIVRPDNPLAKYRFLTTDGEEIPLTSNPILPSFGSFDSDNSDDDFDSTEGSEKVQDVVATSLVLSPQEARAFCSELYSSSSDTNQETRSLSLSSRCSSPSSLASLERNLAFLAIEDPDPEAGSSTELCRAVAFFRSVHSRPCTPFAFAVPGLPDEDDEDEASPAVDIPRENAPRLVSDTDSSDGSGSEMSVSPTEAFSVPTFPDTLGKSSNSLKASTCMTGNL